MEPLHACAHSVEPECLRCRGEIEELLVYAFDETDQVLACEPMLELLGSDRHTHARTWVSGSLLA